MIQTLTYPIHDLLPYINWLYFFHAWGMPPRMAALTEVHDCPGCLRQWVERERAVSGAVAAEAARLYADALQLLRELDADYPVRARFALYPAWSEEEDIVVWVTSGDEKEGRKGTGADSIKDSIEKGKRDRRLLRLPFLRQQQRQREDLPYLCLSDFVVPHALFPHHLDCPAIADLSAEGRGRALGVFATAADPAMESLYPDDDYRRMLVQTLCDRLAEAAAERMHEEVRRTYWGYAADEHHTPRELFAERYEGRRPAVGYPSIPDQSINFLLDELLDFSAIGIRLTENGMMCPHAAVSGLLLDHPAARHFSVGTIGEDQVRSYASRRGWHDGEEFKYLAAVMSCR